MDWVEIIEPRSRQPMYANLISGECTWDPPASVTVRPAHGNQWWELYDDKTHRYYYYNVNSQQTNWNRPNDADIIPLTKLQSMKRRSPSVKCGDRLSEGHRLSGHVTSSGVMVNGDGCVSPVASGDLCRTDSKPPSVQPAPAISNVSVRRASYAPPQSAPSPPAAAATDGVLPLDSDLSGSSSSGGVGSDSDSSHSDLSGQMEHASRGTGGATSGGVYCSEHSLADTPPAADSAGHQRHQAGQQPQNGSHKDRAKQQQHQFSATAATAAAAVGDETCPRAPPRNRLGSSSHLLRSASPRSQGSASGVAAAGLPVGHRMLRTDSISSTGSTASGSARLLRLRSPLAAPRSSYSQSVMHELPGAATAASLPAAASTSQSLFDLITDEGVSVDDGGHMEKYVRQNIGQHKPGLFRKKISLREMLSWSKEPIRQPMLVSVDKSLRKAACSCFRLVLVYMGDCRSKSDMSGDSVGAQLLQLVATDRTQLADEVLVQLCRQTTDNPHDSSLRLGWQLLAICLHFFEPSSRLRPFLNSYLDRHRQPELEAAARRVAAASVPASDIPSAAADHQNAIEDLACSASHRVISSATIKPFVPSEIAHLSQVCRQRLDRPAIRLSLGNVTDKIVQLSRLQIFRPSMFGCSLAEVMAQQADWFPQLQLPWIIQILTQLVLNLGGTKTEGIFRVAAECDGVCALKMEIDLLLQSPTAAPDTDQVLSLLAASCAEVDAAASLLKQWLRQLWRPLVPERLHDPCLVRSDDRRFVLQLLTEQLPRVNLLTLMYLVRFLQKFCDPAVVACTKMSAQNLAMVFAPNIFPFKEVESRDLMQLARKNVLLLKTLIDHMDTTSVDTL